MRKLFFMYKVKSQEQFEKKVKQIAKQQNAKLFHRYVAGDIFKIATAKKVQEFDFSFFTSDKEIIKLIQGALEIL